MSSLSLSIQKKYKYDVFLSFRGKDTRKNFVDHLYEALTRQGIHVYKDDEKLGKGKKIKDELLKSIEESKFYIVVFSKNYASSSWCLDELVEIMESQKKASERVVYPVFYDVEPFEIRKQHGAVGETFTKHGEEDVRKWRTTLQEAAGLVGWDLKNYDNGHEAKFITKIVEEISLQLRSINLNIDEKLIGMESRIKDVEAYIEPNSDIRMIGIKGIGGGGKTTLARAIFDKIHTQFESKSFVENVREVSKSSIYGLQSLQKQVLSDVLRDQGISVSNIHHGKNMLKNKLCCKKVLVVLDDIDHKDQLEALAGELTWFKPGSRVIITTRDEQVLVAHGVKWIHDVTLLSIKEAMCLFSRFAFGRDFPNQGYEKLSCQVARYADGLPLTIKVLGSFLCGKTKLEWIDALERLKTIPLKETLEKLELSYIGLEDDYKEIFLYIVCLLKGCNKDDAIRTLEYCGFHARNGLRVLEQKSLVSIVDGKYVGMHDHIEEMGRNIVRRSHPDEPERHRLLWICEEVEDVLVNQLGTEATRCIRVSGKSLSSGVIMKGLENMTKLRYLMVNCPIQNNFRFGDLRVDEDSQYFPNTLRYLCWIYYPRCSLPKNFRANNLVALELAYSFIEQLWEGAKRKVLNKLKFLDLSCSKLKSLDLALTPNLERLNLYGCHDLIELHTSSGCLERLVYLNINQCLNLKSHSFVRHLKSLEVFHPSMPHLTKFLDNSNNNLLELWFRSDSIEGLPSSIGNLHKLVSLNLIYCWNLKTLPQSICCLKRLRNLNLFSSAIEELSDDLGHLECLETIGLSCTRVKSLPESICMLKHLKTLLLKYCKALKKLPVDIGELESLERLHLSYCCMLKSLPTSICKLKHLKEFDLRGCVQLVELPMKLGDLRCLEELDLAGSNISYLPRSLSLLKGVKIIGFESKDISTYAFSSRRTNR